MTGYSENRYNNSGQLVKTSYPFSSLSTPESSKTWNTYSYDVYGRLISQTSPYTNMSYSYSTSNSNNAVNTTTVTDHLRNITCSKICDAAGRITGVADPGGSISYVYSYQTVAGKSRYKLEISTNGVTTVILSDMCGNRVLIDDPDAGTITNTYNHYGELVSEVDASQNTTTYSYDILGRLAQKTISGSGTTNNVVYSYDNAEGKGVGKIHSIMYNNSSDVIFSYDNLGRVSNKQRYVDNISYSHQYTYNSYGQLYQITYPDGFCIKHTYNSIGELVEIRTNSNNSLIYKIDTRNKYRQPLRSIYGNNTGVQYTYNAYGMVTQIKRGNKTLIPLPDQDNNGTPVEKEYAINDQYGELNYTYNNRGMIASRTDAKVSQYESYSYDNLDRLVSYSVGTTGSSNPSTVTHTYEANGNITYKSTVGNYLYENTQPHAVKQINGIANCPVSSTQCNVTYNSMNRPATVSEGIYQLNLSYGSNRQRHETTLRKQGTQIKSKCFVSRLHEMENSSSGIRRMDYIYADGNIVAVRVKKNNADSLYYIHTDHLGSWNRVLDQNKNTRMHCHYDPWGNRKLYTNWKTDYTATSFLFDRGFTGHEHLDPFNIINMNARLYDPVIGRFFSPDNYVASTTSSQDLNRYSYCRNNPLSFTDPDGEWIHLVIGAVIGGAINWILHGAEFTWQGAGYFGVGSFAGAVGAGIGAGVSSAIAGTGFGAGFIGASSAVTAASSFLSGAAIGGTSGTVAGFTTGLGNGLVSGQNFGNALQNGAVDGFIGGTAGALLGGVVGGIDAARDGRRFWDGKSPYKDVSLNITFVGQDPGSMDCLFANSEMLEKYYGGERTLEDFREIYNTLPEGATVTDYYSAAGFEIMGNPENAMHIIRTMELNKFPTTITTYEGNYNGKDLLHNSTITRVRMWTPKSKAVFWVNDPIRGANYRMSQNKLYSIIWSKLTIGGIL